MEIQSVIKGIVTKEMNNGRTLDTAIKVVFLNAYLLSLWRYVFPPCVKRTSVFSSNFTMPGIICPSYRKIPNTFFTLIPKSRNSVLGKNFIYFFLEWQFGHNNSIDLWCSSPICIGTTWIEHDSRYQYQFPRLYRRKIMGTWKLPYQLHEINNIQWFEWHDSIWFSR